MKQITANEKTSEGAFLRGKALRGSLITISGYGVTQLLRLGGNVLLARMLFPEAFGLMALIMMFMQGLAMFSDLGLIPSIINSRRGDDPVFLNTAWTLQVIRGMALCLIASLLAYPFSLAYDQPVLASLIPMASLSALLAGFNSTKLATQNRKLKFEKITIIEIASQVGAIVVMVTWASMSPEVWVLIAGVLTGNLIKLVLSHFWLDGKTNRFLWNPDAARSLLSFGKWIFLSTIFHFLASQSDKLIFGKLVSIELLGVYSIALILAGVPFSAISQLSSKIIFPLFCRVKDNGGIPHEIYDVTVKLYMCIGTLVTVLTFVGGPIIIQILYDERYYNASDLLQLIVIGKWFEVVLGDVRGAALLAHSKPSWNAFGSAAKLVVISIIVVPVFNGYGFYFAVISYSLAEFSRYIVFVIGTNKVGLIGFSRDMLMTILVASTIFLMEWGVRCFPQFSDNETSVRLTLCSILMLTWLIMVYIFRGRFKEELGRWV